MAGKTLYEKIWDAHVVRQYDDGDSLLYIDRHLVQEVSSPQAFAKLDDDGHKIRKPENHIALPDHAVPTIRKNATFADGLAARQVERLRANAINHNVEYIAPDDQRHGIVHVIGPELGFTLPGTTLVCGDSHTCTHGAFGCLAFGIGASECANVFSTQTLRQKRQKTMQVELSGPLPFGVTVKDIILSLISQIGADGGVGHALEFTGSTIPHLSMHARMTLCNMAIEAGSRVGMVAVDDTTLNFLKDRPYAPKGALWDLAVENWRTLKSDETAVYDSYALVDVSSLEPQISWGTSPEQTSGVTAHIPFPQDEPNLDRRRKLKKSLEYMGLTPGTALRDIAIDRVFIGSCTNGRLEDLRAAASVVKGKHISKNVSGMVVPGSAQTRAAAEEEGLDKIFLDAGFEWREAGCSMCVGMNDDRLSDKQRCASTSNRNFEGRQGQGGRTHLVSPQMAAAAALTGHLTDVREHI
ncbi:3-isopropylmalate/(R)-2-methylmalate dehydratase large subunit [Sulfitobacter marinus]|uniref:3-isopropylmalate dehydratase large subunit n=1 Tax=Sulfitobacter marinus TaxID=394264 RepID=A0A1I6R066_9RHOB|nr:3-isopropylmalate dehydratase large subunit [Sulfitobacter marinus]SFS58109.1 3-isopropylmalate/(R)-2-methylmalate dehydratase large subunit [Sulfitobacter marinus]